MLAHNIKEILTLIPEALPMVKSANLEEDFPIDNKDSVTASYLRMHYLEKVASTPVASEVKELLEKAANLHDIKEELDPLIKRFHTMEKTASYQQELYGLTLKDQEALFEGDLGGFGFLSLEKAASVATDLVSKYGEEITSEEVRRYAGHCWLNKEAAVKSLANRYYATKDTDFIKVARVVVDSFKDNIPEDISNLCRTVTTLDKRAGLDIVGFNFYKEALFTKEADYKSSLYITLNGEQIPYEKIISFGKDRISSAIGKDIGSAITGNPTQDKYMLESLPVDLQRVLQSLLKSV